MKNFRTKAAHKSNAAKMSRELRDFLSADSFKALPYALNDYVSGDRRVVLTGSNGAVDIVLEDAYVEWYGVDANDNRIGRLAGWSVPPMPLRRGQVQQRAVVELRAIDPEMFNIVVTNVTFV